MWKTIALFCLAGSLVSMAADQAALPVESPRDIPLTRISAATASSVRTPQLSADKAVDGNTATLWQSEIEVIKTKGPQWLMLEMDEIYTIDALRYFLASKVQEPNREYANWICRIQDYEIQVSSDGKEFKTVASGTWDKKDLKEQRVAFPSVKAKFVKLICKTADRDGVSVTELRLESPEPPQPKAKPVAQQPAPSSAKPVAAPNRSQEIITEVPPPPMDTPRDIPHTRMKATATTQRNDYCAVGKAIDGNLEQGWMSELDALSKKGPQALTLELDAIYTVDALRYFLEASSRIGHPVSVSWIGRVQKYEIQVSTDGKTFATVASGEWNKEDLKEQRVEFKPVQARFVKLVCISAGSNGAGASEISLESPNHPKPVGIKVKPPQDAEARLKVFAGRNSLAQHKEIAGSIYHWVNRQNPAFQEYCTLYEKGNYAAALRVFNKALIERCRSLQGMLLSKSGTGIKTSIGIPVEMMTNVISSPELPEKFDVGEPGCIDWESPLMLTELKKKLARTISPETFTPLLVRYQQSGDVQFLTKWAAFQDDLAMFNPGYANCTSFDIADRDSVGVGAVGDLLIQLLLVELERPGLMDKLPETTLPRLLLKMIPENLSLSATYFHSNAQNWTPAQAATMIHYGILLDDLIVQDVPLIEQAVRHLERYEVLSNMPDGTEVEQAMWYNWGYAEHLLDALEDLEHGPAPSTLITPEWKTEAWESILRRLRFTCHIFTQQGQWPIFLRGDSCQLYGIVHMSPGAAPKANRSPLFHSPILLEDPYIKPMLTMIGPDKKPGASLPFNSNYFPWGGYRIIRESWDPNSQYACMFSSPKPGKYWARGGTDQLNLGLHAFGKDLLKESGGGNYAGFASPVMVDGLNQNYRAGYPRWGHKQILLNGWKKPDNSRWVSSDAFDFMEGTYSGPYGQLDNALPADVIEKNKQSIRNVTHQRQVIFIRQAGLWIATDRITSDKPHDYTWHWILPSLSEKDKNTPFVFLPQEIQTNEAEKSIVTAKPEGENLTMKTFCPGAMKYQRNESEKNKVCDITGTIKGQQDLLAVTPILPRKNMQNDFKSLSQLSSNTAEGFSAVTPDDSLVIYTAARKGSAALAAGGAKADAEILLIVEKNDKIAGLVLGCKSLVLNGTTANVPGADFVFELRGKSLAKVTPILRPIELVEIQPARNVFVGEETISMSCPTAGIEIRYSTDGKEPSRESKLYTQPFKITESARIKGKAFRSTELTAGRPGFKEAPCELDFTHISPETLAVFTYEKPAAAVKAANTQPGLNYAYYEGDWQKLMMNVNLVEPVGRGVVPTVLDISPRKTKGRFTFIYDGYIDVPADGVYTFHAPVEFTDNKIDNGYDLVLRIDGKRWYPSTRRHAFGNWSVALAKGKHAFQLKYLDYRGDTVVLRLASDDPEGRANPIQIDYTAKGNPINFSGMNGNWVWGGGVPELMVSGPGLEKQPIPAAWLSH